MTKAALFVFLLALSASPEARVYKPTSMKDLEDLAVVLRRHVASLEVEVKPQPNELADLERQGYAVALDGHHLAVLCFTVENAKRVLVEGPSGRRIEAKVTVYDGERRVAILETKAPIQDAGLSPATIAAKSTRNEGDDVFALVHPGEDTSIVHGVFIYVGDDPEYGGHHRIDMKLTHGMPVFDNLARFVGYARAVAWDKDPLMLITPEMIEAARTSTASASKSSASKSSGERPWWSK
jgi:hypothetical protein